MNEHRFYARDIGPALALSLSGGVSREELVSYAPAHGTLRDLRYGG